MKRKSEVAGLGLTAKTKHPRACTFIRIGELAELAFHHKVTGMGFGATRPYGNHESYDFIVDSGDRLWRVQVKSTSNMDKGAYRLAAHHFSCARGPEQAYTPKQIDILAAYIRPADAWYIIPVDAFSPHLNLLFFPHRPGSGGKKYERFREAWFVIACRRSGEPRDGIVTSPACTYSPSSGTSCPGCPYKKK